VGPGAGRSGLRHEPVSPARTTPWSRSGTLATVLAHSLCGLATLGLPTLLHAPGRASRVLPVGSRIAFESFRRGNGEIYVMAAAGSGATNLSRNPAREMHPCCTLGGGT
jgi:hypothetical protein